MNNRKHIAVIGLKGLPAYGGAASVGENIITNLHDSFEFTVYSVSSHTELQTGQIKNFCNQIVFKSIRYKKINSLLYYLKSAFHVLISSYDLIHLHHRDAAFIIPILRLKYKVVLTTHGMVLTDKWKRFSFAFTFQDRFFLRFASIITTVSLKDYDIVRSIVNSNSMLVRHIPNGINETSFIYDKKNLITFAAGRILPSKGLHIFLEAVKKKNHRVEIQIIGDLCQMKDYKESIENLINRISNVTQKGLIKDKQVLFEAIGSSKLFVYPSIIESMSMMMLEVASLGVPMICSRIKENTDVFNEEEVLYFEANNSDDLAEKISWALDNMLIMHDKAKNAHKKLLNNYLWKDIALQYSRVYNLLLDK